MLLEKTNGLKALIIQCIFPKKVEKQGDIMLPVDVECREKTTAKSPHKEAYILQNTAKKRYVIGLRENNDERYKEHIQSLAKMMNDKQITTFEAARVWLDTNITKDTADE